MRSIFKYPIRTTDQQSITLPMNATVLSVQMQGIDLCIWALVDPEGFMKTKEIYIFGTGHPVPDDLNATFINTVQDGPLVWHVFVAKGDS